WVNPYSPVMPLLAAMSSPFLDVIRRRLQPIGGVDLSPLVLLVVCQLILTWPIESLYRSVIQFLM
ncbi:MAG: YggT family protein, partial [Betaproteobacteria bacterium]